MGGEYVNGNYVLCDSSFKIYIYIYVFFFFFKFLFLPDNLQRDGHKIERRVTAIIQKAP